MISNVVERTTGSLLDQGLRTGEGFLKGDMDNTLISRGLKSTGLGDSAAGQVVTGLVSPYLAQIRGKVVDSITGTDNQSIGASSFLSDESKLEQIKRAEQEANISANISPAVEGVADAQATESTIKAHQSLLGYSREEAERKVAAGGLAVAAMKGAAKQGAVNVQNASIEASAELARENVSARDVTKFAGAVQGAMYKADIQDNKFKGLTSEDKSFLLKNSVNSGEASKKGDANAKAKNVVEKAAEKAEGVSNLRSIYGENQSSEELIGRANALKGENVLAQRGDNFARQTESLQQLKMNTGVDDKELGALTASSYKDIAAFGGRAGLAQSTAEATIRLTAGRDTTVSGLSKEDYTQNMSSFVADTVKRGDTRNVASAYRLWLDKNKEKNSSENFQKFQEQTKNMDLTSSKGVFDFIKKTTGESGVAAQQTYHAVFNSEATKELEQDSNILAEATSKRLEQSGKGYIDEAKKAVGGEKRFKKLFGSDEEFSQKTAEDIRSTLMDKSDELGGVGNVYKMTEKIQGAAERAALASGMDTKTWQQAQISSKRSKEISGKDITSVKRFQELDRGKGLEGITRMLEEKAAKGDQATPADLISQGLLGVNEEQIRAVSASADANVMDNNYERTTKNAIESTKREHGISSESGSRGNSTSATQSFLETPSANPNVQGLTAIAEPINKILSYVQEIARKG